MKKSQPIRMCLVCRSKHPQNTLIRLKQEGKDVTASDGLGRSFYLCDICSTNEKKIRGLVKRFKQNETQFTALIKKLTVKVNACEKS
ncbi:MAG: DUF448 domain-containing protein [Epsilonproteobacteria bacterium]|nr:MAG: DUF448 domain-containing protein [Campylobacterota bacterium]